MQLVFTKTSESNTMCIYKTLFGYQIVHERPDIWSDNRYRSYCRINNLKNEFCLMVKKYVNRHDNSWDWYGRNGEEIKSDNQKVIIDAMDLWFEEYVNGMQVNKLKEPIYMPRIIRYILWGMVVVLAWKFVSNIDAVVSTLFHLIVK